jgi:hypothetical protein
MKLTQTLCLFLLTAILLGACAPVSTRTPTLPAPSLPTAKPPQFKPMLTWQSIDQPCMVADFTVEEISFGECASPLTSVPGKVQSERLTELVEYFAPFSASTQAGTVNFGGKGTTVATEAEQRAIAEWAKLNFEAARSGNPDKAWSLAFSYHHNSQGCEDVAISSTGLVLVSVCEGFLGQTYLTAPELEQLYGWIDSLASEEVTSQPDQSPSPSTFVVKLNGTGSKQSDEQTIRSMVEFANEIFLQVSFSVNAPTEKNEAERALRDYFAALHSGDYSLAAKLYGGDTNLLQTWNPDITNNLPMLLQRACTQNGLKCLLPRSITYRGPDSNGGYRFFVELNNDDGTFFYQGSGGPGTESVSVFLCRVVKAESGYVVMDLPPYLP